ncbi:MAG: hypothetical protein AAFU67_13415, partial [Bacteroidota bacterium]
MAAGNTVYHPSLALGNIVEPGLFKLIQEINAAQGKIDAAQEQYSAALSMKRSLAMTVTELAAMNIDTEQLSKSLQDTDKKILTAAQNYVQVRIQEEGNIHQAKTKIADEQTPASIESPIDFERSKIVQFPLGADSLKLDAQYFSFDRNVAADPSAAIASVENFVQEQAAELGTKAANEISRKAGKQLEQQIQNHQLAGTLVITASCTHKNASIFAPLELDVDKAIAAWNLLNPKGDIDPSDADTLRELENKPVTKGSKKITLLTGMNQGSSFVGMVHLLSTENLKQSSTQMAAVAAQLQERFVVGGWLEDATGGIGVDPNFTDDIRRLLSSQEVSSHITLTTLGVIPSVKSKELQMGVKGFSDLSQLSQQMATVDQLSKSSQKTVNQGADTARTGAKVAAMQGATIGSLLQSLGTIDQQANKVLDINSLMTAFEDYLQEIKKGN